MISVRKQTVCYSSRAAILALLLVVVLSSALSAQERTGFYDRQQAGIRLGGWINQGGLPIDSSLDVIADVGDNNFYAELYGAWRIFKRGFLEVSLGFGNRGDVTVLDSIIYSDGVEEVQYVGSLVIYPVVAQLKYYLPGFNKLLLKPYIEAGGGLYMGRHSVEFTNATTYTGREQTSRTAFSYVMGAGFDWPLSQSIGLELNTRYFPIKFGEDLFEEKDYSAVAVTVGVKYMFIPTKKKHRSRPDR